MHIFVDWGSTNFRAFLISGDTIAGRKEAAGYGVLQHFRNFSPQDRRREYSVFLEGQLREWLASYPDASILMCGAVGSREGWVDTGYISAPADFKKLSEHLYALNAEEKGLLADRSVLILPGLTIAHGNGRHDVMRSEEIKSLGATAHLGRDSAVLCIPGTHCKWVRVSGGAVVDFHSVLTGEFYNVLSEKGSLAPLFVSETDGDPDLDSFDRGLALSQEGDDLLADIWQVRSQKLRSPTPPASLKSYLSGILIGHEIRRMNKAYPDLKGVILLSDPGARQSLYQRALEKSGLILDACVESEVSVCTGLSRLKSSALF